MRPHEHACDDQLDAATWSRHLIPDGSVYAFLADHRHQLFPAALFADVARPGGGRPSVPAEVIATVMVLQALEDLSDREAISALQRDIVWKVACGLRLDDECFHPTVLVHWRNRIRTCKRPRRIFEAVRQVVEATGAPPAGAWPCPPRRRLGAGLRALLPFGGVTMSRIVCQPTGAFPHGPENELPQQLPSCQDQASSAGS